MDLNGLQWVCIVGEGWYCWRWLVWVDMGFYSLVWVGMGFYGLVRDGMGWFGLVSVGKGW